MTSWNPTTPFSGLPPRFDGGEPHPTPGISDGTASGPLPQAGSSHGFPQPQGRPFGFADVRAHVPEGQEDAGDETYHAEASFHPTRRGEAEPVDGGYIDEPEADEHATESYDDLAGGAEHDPEPEVAEVEEHVPVMPEPVAAALPEEPSRKERRARLPRGQSGGNGGRGSRSGRKIVGLKIGASQIAAAVVSNRDGRHVLHQLARTPLEAGVVVDGEVRDAGALASALRAFFADHRLPTRDVRLGLASNRIGVRTFDIVGVDDPARVDNAVRFKAHEVLPVAVHESMLDYRVLSSKPTEGGESVKRVLLVVAPRDQVQPYVDVCSEAGLRFAGLDLEALGLLRAFIDPVSVRGSVADDRATVVISIGHEASTLLVAGGGIAEFARVFDWGGSQLVDALAQELSLGTGEAAAVLRRMSLAAGSRSIDGLDEETRGRAYDAVRLRLTPFARELVSSLQFYQTQPDSLGIGEIVITGGTSQLEGLDEALNQIIGVPVRVGDPLARVVVEGRVDPDVDAELGSLAVPVGLAIDDDQARGVNLLTRETVASRRMAVGTGGLGRVLVPVAAAVPLVVMSVLFWQAHSDVSGKEETLAAKEAQLASMPKPRQPVLGPGVGADQQARATALSIVMGQRLAWDGVLRDVAKILPSDVWLTELRAASPTKLSDPAAVAAAPATASAPVTPTGVTITGFTYKQADVAELLTRLSSLPRLQNVQLGGSQKSSVADKDVIEFTILADLSSAGGS
jgi:type IV pilus assembly protein PilM